MNRTTRTIVAAGVALHLAFLLAACAPAAGTDEDGPTVATKTAVEETATAEETAAVAAKAEEDRLAAEASAAAEAAAEAAVIAAEGTVAQQNAYKSAVSYIGYSGFSRQGLTDQLLYEEFSPEDVEFGIARLEAEGGVDWNAEAAESAASYLSNSTFSRDGLIDQLLYEGFTAEQAEYGVSTTGL